MIPKPLREITNDDLQALITNAVREGPEIEYKLQVTANNDSDKKEFLADVSSFANSGGGDLVIGMEEENGIPTQVVGVDLGDPDKEIRRLDSIISSGLDPKIRQEIWAVDCENGRQVLIIRVQRNWLGPHRVIFGGHDKFYGRNSAGKYPMDVRELGAAFTLPTAATGKIRAFRADRIMSVANNQTPVTMATGFKVVLHCLPLDAFATEKQYDLLPLYDDWEKFKPMSFVGGMDRRFNLDGIVKWALIKSPYSYTQLYRNGAIEVVDASTELTTEVQGTMTIASADFENHILEYAPHCFDLFKHLGVNPPVAVGLALVNVRGHRMRCRQYQAGYAADSDVIVVPETVVTELSQPTEKLFKRMLDLVWNAFGYKESPHFDETGKRRIQY